MANKPTSNITLYVALYKVIKFIEEWTFAMDEGFGVDVVSLDYSKAFDLVPHK